MILSEKKFQRSTTCIEDFSWHEDMFVENQVPHEMLYAFRNFRYTSIPDLEFNDNCLMKPCVMLRQLTDDLQVSAIRICDESDWVFVLEQHHFNQFWLLQKFSNTTSIFITSKFFYSIVFTRFLQNTFLSEIFIQSRFLQEIFTRDFTRDFYKT